MRDTTSPSSDPSRVDHGEAGGAATAQLRGLPMGGRVVGRNFDGWSEPLRQEFRANAHNRLVVGRLLSETDSLKVWDIRLAPGRRLTAHCPQPGLLLGRLERRGQQTAHR